MSVASEKIVTMKDKFLSRITKKSKSFFDWIQSIFITSFMKYNITSIEKFAEDLKKLDI